MKCSIVIRTYNEQAHIAQLLRGLGEQSFRDFEIIIVDSGSTDDTLKIVSDFPAQVVTIDPTSFSFGGSLNAGCQVARGEFVVFASAHTYPIYTDWLETLLAPFSDERVALVYGKQRGDSRTRYAEEQVFKKWFPDHSNLSQKEPFCNNANAAIRKLLWHDTPYDEELLGLEDIDWATRVISRGFCLAYVSHAEIAHVHDETATQVYNRYWREAASLKLIFPEQQFSVFDFLRLAASNITSDYVHALRDGQLASNLLDIPLFRLMQFAGTYSGYRHPERINHELRKTLYYPHSVKPAIDSNQSQQVKPSRTAIDYANIRNPLA